MRKIIPMLTLVFMTGLILAACSTQPAPEDPMIGTTAPEFTLDNALGGETSLSDYQGKPVLLYFHMAVG